MNCFTSINFAYLSRARVLAKTVKKHHPNWHFIAVITDKPPEHSLFNENQELFDEIIWAEDLGIQNFNQWIFGHNVVEACTAVKPFALDLILTRQSGHCIYLDPDIAVINPLNEVVQLLDTHDIILTPHQLAKVTKRQAIIDNEMGSLKYGVFNLGFIAVSQRESAKQFRTWWCERLYTDCIDDTANGIFVDQKWCDLVPSLFDNVKILRHPGYNVASWNIEQRDVHYDNLGNIKCGNFPLIFYHFTKYGILGETMTKRYGGYQLAVFDLWRWYGEQLHDSDSKLLPNNWWKFGYFTNGELITNEMRRIYRNRADLNKVFPNPFDTQNDFNYYIWFKERAKLDS